MSVISDLLGVHPETLRVWEKSGLIRPGRRNGKRFYSENDLKRLRFIQKLIKEGLNVPGVAHFLHLYPCWWMEDCPVCMHRSKNAGCARSCWKEEGTSCEVSVNEDMCAKCEYRHLEKPETVSEPGTSGGDR